MASIVALLHSQGFVLHNHFHCLEFAYVDVTNPRITHLIVESPYSFSLLKAIHPMLPVTVSINPPGDTVLYSGVVRFLRDRHALLQQVCEKGVVVFGYKGKSYQTKVLREAGITNAVDLKDLGVPSIDRLSNLYYPEVSRTCTYHPKTEKRCAELTVRLLSRYMTDNEDLIREKMAEIFK